MSLDSREDFYDVFAERPEHPEEACGVFGVYAPGEDVARLTYFGLHALQHRGQESAGIAVGDNETVTVTKNLGLVSRVSRTSDSTHCSIVARSRPASRSATATPSR